MAYEMCTDFIELVSGVKDHSSRAYTEAVEEMGYETPEGNSKIESLMTDINHISSKVRDSRISASRGNITKFKGYDNIKTAMSFIRQNIPNASNAADLHAILRALEMNRDIYQMGYTKNNKLIQLEYENVTYVLVTGLAVILACDVDLIESPSGIKVVRKSGETHGVINKTIKDTAKQVSNTYHLDYLQALLKASEMKGNSTPIGESVDYFTEGVINAIGILNTILYNTGELCKFAKRTFIGLKQSAFGIIPLIRSIIYLRYKKKSDTIAALQEQCRFLAENIERLENRTNMDPKKKAVIIKRQKAYIMAYKKKAERLRAELCEGEREATVIANKTAEKIPQKPTTPTSTPEDDDDLVLEYVELNTNF